MLLALWLGYVAFGAGAQTTPPQAERGHLPYENVPAYWPAPAVPPPKWPQAHPDARPDPGMTRIQYWEKLCRLEAGDFITRTVENVEGLYLIRPLLVRDTRWLFGDWLFHARYQIEDPYTAWTSTYLQYSNFPILASRFAFVEMPAVNFARDMPTAIELYNGGRKIPEPFVVQMEFVWKRDEVKGGISERRERDILLRRGGEGRYLRYTQDPAERIDEVWLASGGGERKLFKQNIEEQVPTIKSRYGVYWRGVRRPRDREMGIGGGEIFVIDLATNEILGYRRGFVLAMDDRYKPYRVEWGTQAVCPNDWRELGTNNFITRVAVSTRDMRILKEIKEKQQ